MKNKNLLIIILLLTAVFVLTPNAQVHAQTLFDFGGVVSYPLTCTCPATIGNIWIWFTPLDLGGPGPLTTGPLVYSLYGTVFLYSNFLPGVPLYQHIGDFIPAVQACWMYAGYFCYPLIAEGLMFQLGTS